MASRYLRATGNWNGPVWAATSGGTAGSAATPTASDDVYINANYTVTLTANAVARKVFHTNGQLNLSSYKLSLGFDLQSFGDTARTINLGSGTLELLHGWFYLLNTNLTFSAGTSQVIFNMVDGDVTNDFYTASKTFNDVTINIGEGDSYNYSLQITGSPTFRSLIIQSKNSAAHTVNFDGWTTVNKLVAVGSSASNRLTLQSTHYGEMTHYLAVDEGGTTYGQFVNMRYGFEPHGADIMNSAYIGSNSIDGGQDNDQGQWLTQDPPKMSALVDPLTTAPGSNTNWTVDSSVALETDGIGGGGYSLQSADYMVTTDTYDLVDSEVVYELRTQGAGSRRAGVTAFVAADGQAAATNNPAAIWDYYYTTRSLTTTNAVATDSMATYGFIKSKISGNIMTVSTYADGTWTTRSSMTLSETELLMMRSVRFSAYAYVLGPGKLLYIGSINPTLPASTGSFFAFF